jgi:hypothetical protein
MTSICWNCHKPANEIVSELQSKLDAVQKLSDNLSTLKWQIGADEGWTQAVNAIKKEIDAVLGVEV